MCGDRGSPAPGHLVSRYTDWVGRRACRRGLRGGLKDQLSRTVMRALGMGCLGRMGCFKQRPSPLAQYPHITDTDWLCDQEQDLE